MLISDYPFTKFRFVDKEFGIFECLKSESQLASLKNPTLEEKAVILSHLANEHGMAPDATTFFELASGKAPSDAYEKKLMALYDARDVKGEYDRGKAFYTMLAWKRKYVAIMYPFYGTRCGSKKKAQQLYDLLDMYSGDNDVKRLFFMLAYKFSYKSRCTLPSNNHVNLKKSRKMDTNYIVYEQASNALWDFIEEEEVRVRQLGWNKKRGPAELVMSRLSVSKVWMDWVRDKGVYVDFVESIGDPKNKHRLAVFTHFIWFYLSQKTGSDNARRLRIKL
jgi:hypothetical protein